jgi:diguanylate cyclase (GGDEF)-like protein/PAS domain S-box-containing protein
MKSKSISVDEIRANKPATDSTRNKTNGYPSLDIELKKVKKKTYRDFIRCAKFGFLYTLMVTTREQQKDLLILEVNDSFIDITGFTSPRGKFISDFMKGKPDSLKLVMDYCNQALTYRDSRVDTDIYSQILQRWIHLSIYSPCDPYLMITVDDISEQKTAEEEIRKKQQYYELIAKFSNDLIARLDLDGNITWASPAVQKIFGYSMDELIGVSPYTFIHPDDQVQISDMENYGSGSVPGPLTFTCRLRAKDGKYLWTETVIDRIRDETGKLIGFQTASREINHRMEAIRFLGIERDLGLALSRTDDLEDANNAILEAVMRIDGVDCAGIFLVNSRERYINLVAHRGLDGWFQQLANRISMDDPFGEMFSKAVPIFLNDEKDFTPEMVQAGIRGVAAVPVSHEGNTVAALVAASHQKNALTESTYTALTSMANILGSALSRIITSKALVETRKDFAALFQSISEFIFVVNIQGIILRMNPALLIALGYSENELIGRELLCIYGPEVKERAKIISNQLVLQETSQFTNPMIAKNGNLIPVETQVTRGSWDGEPVYIGVSRDISDRLHAEEEARARDAQFRQIVMTAKEGIWTLNRELKTTFVNQEIQDMLGYTSDEMVGRSVDDFIFPEDVPDHLIKMNERRKGFSSRYERRFLRKDGTYRWILVSASSLKDMDGNFAGTFAMMTDIHDRKRLEMELEASEKRYREIVERQGEGVYITDKNAVFIYANAISERLFGVDPGQLVGRDARDLLSPDQVEVINQQVVLRSRKIQSTYELTVIQKDGRLHHLLITATPRLDDQQNYIGAIGICRDITERKEEETKLRYIGHHDALTNLYNRAYFEETMHALAYSHEFPISYLMMDIDGLKSINDQFGHAEGDHLLKEVAEILRHSIRDTDIAARIGGDEFVVILPLTGAQALAHIQKRIQHSIQTRNRLTDKPYKISLSEGGVTVLDTEGLLHAPDTADSIMYKQKHTKQVKH